MSAPQFRSPLDRWLWKHRVTAADLAAKTGLDEATISRARSGLGVGPRSRKLIAKATGLRDSALVRQKLDAARHA